METKEEFTKKLLCMSCLCVGRTLHEVTNEKRKRYYLDILKEIPLCDMPITSPSICWECNTMLKKVISFREQVKDSYRILQTYTSENLAECLLSDVSRPPRLKVHITQPVTVAPSEAIDIEVEKPEEVQVVCVKDELKVEFDEVKKEKSHMDTTDCPPSDSDMEIDSELQKFLSDVKKNRKNNKNLKSAVKRGKKIVKRLHTEKIKKRTNDVTEKKILTIKLSYEEMLKERQKESSKEVYVKAAYKCETCLIGFNTNKSYKAHVSSKHSPNLGKYNCPICKTIIASVHSFGAHYKRHMRRYECSICHKRTMDMKAMQQHYYSTHEISLKEYKCNLCGKISNSIDTHRYHRDTHKARVQCAECDKTFSHRAGLMNHRLAVHELQNTFPCTVCDKVFRWRTSLKRHLEKHNVKAKGTSVNGEAFCTPCGIEFSSLCSYRRHLRNSLKHVTHDQLKFICDHCNKRFADKTKLRDHIEEKHLHKTYQCHICHKPTKNRVGLDQHIRYVHKSRPNNKMCHYCGKGFPTKVQLESHIRTHTGERPFICEFCPTTFSQQSNLYKHNRQVHLNIKSKRYPIIKKRSEDSKPIETVTAPFQEETAKVVLEGAPKEQQQYCENAFASRQRKDVELILGW